jgi:hypothetical protein
MAFLNTMKGAINHRVVQVFGIRRRRGGGLTVDWYAGRDLQPSKSGHSDLGDLSFRNRSRHSSCNRLNHQGRPIPGVSRPFPGGKRGIESLEKEIGDGSTAGSSGDPVGKAGVTAELRVEANIPINLNGSV